MKKKGNPQLECPSEKRLIDILVLPIDDQFLSDAFAA